MRRSTPAPSADIRTDGPRQRRAGTGNAAEPRNTEFGEAAQRLRNESRRPGIRTAEPAPPNPTAGAGMRSKRRQPDGNTKTAQNRITETQHDTVPEPVPACLHPPLEPDRRSWFRLVSNSSPNPTAEAGMRSKRQQPDGNTKTARNPFRLVFDKPCGPPGAGMRAAKDAEHPTRPQTGTTSPPQRSRNKHRSRHSMQCRQAGFIPPFSFFQPRFRLHFRLRQAPTKPNRTAPGQASTDRTQPNPTTPHSARPHRATSLLLPRPAKPHTPKHDRKKKGAGCNKTISGYAPTPYPIRHPYPSCKPPASCSDRPRGRNAGTLPSLPRYRNVLSMEHPPTDIRFQSFPPTGAHSFPPVRPHR